MNQSETLPRHRRWPSLFAGALATFALTAATVSVASAADQPQVAGLFTDSVSQGNWDPAGFAAFTAMAKTYGFQASHVENASDEQAPAILRSLASRGVKMIIAHSSGYSAAIKEVAPSFPNTQFVLYSYAGSTDGLKNYTAWSLNWDEYGYVIDILAASASKNHHVAVIAGQPIPSTSRSIDFIKKGALSIDPTLKFDVVYIGSFTDIAKAKELATEAIARGADFVVPVADAADAGVQQAAEEQNALTIGEYVDESADYPDAVVSSTVLNFNKAYDEMGKALVNHTLGNHIVQMDYAHHDWALSEPFKNVPAAVQSKVDAAIAQITSGKIDIEK